VVVSYYFNEVDIAVSSTQIGEDRRVALA
jgi:hypothetical protein